MTQQLQYNPLDLLKLDEHEQFTIHKHRRYGGFVYLVEVRVRVPGREHRVCVSASSSNLGKAIAVAAQRASDARVDPTLSRFKLTGDDR